MSIVFAYFVPIRCCILVFALYVYLGTPMLFSVYGHVGHYILFHFMLFCSCVVFIGAIFNIIPEAFPCSPCAISSISGTELLPIIYFLVFFLFWV